MVTTHLRRRAVALALGLLAALVAGGASAADGKRVLDYLILKDGDPIGSEKVEIAADGARTIVTVTASTRVKLLLFNFTYDHSRREVWQGGVLEQVTAKTDDDGTPHTVEMVRTASGYRLTVDGATSDLPATAFPLALWTADVLKSPLLIGVIDGQRYKVTTRPAGEETIQAGGHAHKTRRWRIDGDVERDLWYAEDGTAVQIAFKRRGYDIVYRLR